MDQYNIIIAVDPGLTGGITVIDGKKQPQVYEMPVVQVVVNKSKKNIYDLDTIAAILEPYRGKNVLFIQERVTAMPKQGTTSMFTFGFCSGATLGIAAGIGFDRYEPTPQTWKKNFPALVTQVFLDFKAQAKAERALGKPTKDKLKKLQSLRKTLKDKALKKTNKEEIDKLKEKIAVKDKEVAKISAKAKSEAKRASRELASKLYPKLASRFKRVKDDGVAESLLIAIFGKVTQNELT